METLVAEEIREDATDNLRWYEGKKKELLLKIKRFKAMSYLTEEEKDAWDAAELSLMVISFKAEAVFDAFVHLGIFTNWEALTVLDKARKDFGLSEDGKRLV